MQLFQNLEPIYILCFVVKLVIYLLAAFYLGRSKFSWRVIGITVLSVFLLRLFLFEQPLSWRFYQTQLDQDDVGWRQSKAIDHEFRKYYKRRQGIKYLAVGTSQTKAVYRGLVKEREDLAIFSLAWMSILDLNLYANYLKTFNADYILLYLSEIDLARKPVLEVEVLSPAQGLSGFKNYPLIYGIKSKGNGSVSLKEILFAEFFPEYKYSFLAKGLMRKIFDTKKSRNEKEKGSLQEEAIQLRQRHVEEMLDEHAINDHMRFLEYFLDHSIPKTQQVVIIEGAYHPATYSEKSRNIRGMVNQRLREMANLYERVTYVPQSEIFELNEEDYKDGVHVKDESGLRLAKAILSRVEQTHKKSNQS